MAVAVSLLEACLLIVVVVVVVVAAAVVVVVVLFLLVRFHVVCRFLLLPFIVIGFVHICPCCC